MSQKLLRTERNISREDATEKLHDLADKIGEGKIELKVGNDSIELHPADKVEFELDVEEESDGDLSVEIDIEWPKEKEEKELEIK